MAHQIELTQDAETELDRIKKHERNKIIDEMDKQLLYEPTVSTKNRKCLGTVEAGFEYEPPLWELRVDEYRVFYDVKKESEIVNVRAIRRKLAKQRTKDILQ
jgi:mRNA-degrading endonuclease RelE of RelBE toxin-antitoxin system